IYLIKDMLENERVPDARTVKHIDRCLSCLACMTTCPSGVHYMHLVDHARAYIEERYQRPFMDRALRWLLARILPYPGRFRLALLGAKIGRPFRGLLPDPRLRAMLEMAPKHIPPVSRNDDPQTFPAKGETRMRVALMTGCAQKALNTDINDATIRLLTRLGAEVVVARGAGCCGALTHHMGRESEAHATAARNIRAWNAEMERGLDAIVINASGCGTTVKDYAHMFRTTPLAQDAARVSSIARDISEVLVALGLPEGADKGLTVAYHAACSLQHGQKIKTHPKDLLKRAGFRVVEPADSHLCCGSAGTYNLMQPEISAQLKARKVRTLEAKHPDIIAAGNIGCMMQIGSGTQTPIVHTVELLDWATGGPKPRALGQT
ncbi:MAG: glycolate oxidase subunit GlcF, partial [Pseudooceanicola sp.]|nr:glycolate oxidase subunit GlcF [Pseudooceanicola sp.]